MRYRIVVDGVEELLTFQGIGFDLAVHWLYYASDNTIRRLESGVPDPPALGAAISITFDGTFQTEATAEDAAEIALRGLVEYVEVRDDVTSHAAAQALADSILAERLNAGDQIVRYVTRRTAPTLRAGQQQTIVAVARDLSGTYLITDLRIRAETSDVFVREVTAKRSEGTQTNKWQHTYHDWLGTSEQPSTTTAIGSGEPAVVGPAPPDTAVQFNDGGSFGADASFTYLQDENSIVCGGGGSSLTAVDVESCQVFGYDNHITD
jgi:hypothetical protein